MIDQEKSHHHQFHRHPLFTHLFNRSKYRLFLPEISLLIPLIFFQLSIWEITFHHFSNLSITFVSYQQFLIQSLFSATANNLGLKIFKAFDQIHTQAGPITTNQWLTFYQNYLKRSWESFADQWVTERSQLLLPQMKSHPLSYITLLIFLHHQSQAHLGQDLLVRSCLWELS